MVGPNHQFEFGSSISLSKKQNPADRGTRPACLRHQPTKMCFSTILLSNSLSVCVSIYRSVAAKIPLIGVSSSGLLARAKEGGAILTH